MRFPTLPEEELANLIEAQTKTKTPQRVKNLAQDFQRVESAA